MGKAAAASLSRESHDLRIKLGLTFSARDGAKSDFEPRVAQSL